MKIKAILFDVDGVLTNSKITYFDTGEESKTFNVKDGQLIKFMQAQGYLFGSISGRSSIALQKRMEELHIDFFKQGISNKSDEYENFKQQYALADLQIAYVGDDIIDLAILKKVGLSVAPADAIELVKKYCKIITKAKGGEGVLREVIDFIIETENLESDLLAYYQLN